MSFIFSWSLAARIRFSCRDGFVVPIAAQFLLLQLEDVCFEGGNKLFWGWILFVKTEIRTTSLSRVWILVLNRFKTYKEIFDFVFVFLGIECFDLFPLRLRHLVVV